MTLNLYLLRHGETTFSQSGHFCGETDAELTPEGLQMAVSFADVYQTHIPHPKCHTSTKHRQSSTY